MYICAINNTYCKGIAKSCLYSFTRFYKTFPNIFQSPIGISELQFAYVRIQQCTCLYILFHSYLCPAIKIIMLKISTFLRDIPILFHKMGESHLFFVTLPTKETIYNNGRTTYV